MKNILDLWERVMLWNNPLVQFPKIGNNLGSTVSFGFAKGVHTPFQLVDLLEDAQPNLAFNFRMEAAKLVDRNWERLLNMVRHRIFF